MGKLPLSVTIADVLHRATIYGIVTFCIVGTGSAVFNVYMNSDFAKMNKGKLRFDKAEYDKARENAPKED